MPPVEDIDKLRKKLPRLEHFFDAVADVSYPPVADMPLLNAMVRVVNSQMLSTASASAIFNGLSLRRRKDD